MKEEWRDVVGFEGRYQVSNRGRVKSLDRVEVYTRHDRNTGRDLMISRKLKGKILRPGRQPSGHLTVAIGKGNSRPVHQLVLEAFVGPCPEGYESLHGPAGPAENTLTNLRYGSRSENIAEDYERNVRSSGTLHHWAGKVLGAALANKQKAAQR